MSSILDALKKIEEERARRERGEHEDEVFEAGTAEADLTGKWHSGGGSISVRPVHLVIGAVIAVVCLVGIPVTVVVLMQGGGVSVPPPQHTAANTPQGEASTAPAVAPVPEVTPAPEMPAPDVSESGTEVTAEVVAEPAEASVEPARAAPAPSAEPVATPAAPEAVSEPVETVAVATPEPVAPAPAPVVPVEPVSPPGPVPAPAAEPVRVARVEAPAPTPEPVEPVVPEVASQPPAPVTVAEPAPAPAPTPASPVREMPEAAPQPSFASSAPAVPNEGTTDFTDTISDLARQTKPVNPTTLPNLRGSDRIRYGLENLAINVIREADENRPNAVAIINLNRVFIGERIPGTSAKLIGVCIQGIGIEVDGGKQFFVRW